MLDSSDLISWFLWHGKETPAGQTTGFFEDDVYDLEAAHPNFGKFKRMIQESAV